MRGKSGFFSKLYGVSPRTIRDIWNRKSWAYATNLIWQEEASLLNGTGLEDFDVSNRLILAVSSFSQPFHMFENNVVI